MKKPKPIWKQPIERYVSESDLQKQCFDYLVKTVPIDQHRCFVRRDKFENCLDYGYCPDLIVWLKVGIQDGSGFNHNAIITITFEFKSPKGIGFETNLQKNFNDWISGCEIIHYITNDFEFFRNVIDSALGRKTE